MAHAGPERGRSGTLPFYAGAVVLVLAVAVALSAYSVELGLAKPSASTRRIVIAVAEIDATLDGEADFFEFSDHLYAGLAARRSLAVRNPADGRANRALIGALDCYSAIRESWQMELEGTWDPAIHGDPAYWRSFHAAIELPGEDPLSATELREALRLEALAHARAALELVER
jgi:hypothetical protein